MDAYEHHKMKKRWFPEGKERSALVTYHSDEFDDARSCSHVGRVETNACALLPRGGSGHGNRRVRLGEPGVHHFQELPEEKQKTKQHPNTVPPVKREKNNEYSVTSLFQRSLGRQKQRSLRLWRQRSRMEGLKHNGYYNSNEQKLLIEEDQGHQFRKNTKLWPSL
jgi:hypothetical protein